MNTDDLKEIFAINREAMRIERNRCLQAIDDDPDLPVDMLDEMCVLIAGDSDAIAEALRMVVQQTKDRIRSRIIAGQPESDNEPNHG